MEVLGLYLPYVKRNFQEHQWIIFFLFCSNNLDSVVFGNAAFGEIKDHSLKTRPFQKKLCYGNLRMCLTYVKSYFQEHRLSASLFMAQIIQILLFWALSILQRSKITVWERHLLKKKLSMEVLRLCLPYVKRLFQEYQWSAFLFKAQITQILLFLVMPISLKDHSFRMTPFQKKNFAIEVLGMCLPYVKRYVQEHQLSDFLFKAQIT